MGMPDSADQHLEPPAFAVGSPGAPPFVVSSYTLGTDIDHRGRVQAAAAAGFEGIGLRAENYWAAQEAGLTAADMSEIAAQAGVPVREVEYLTNWGQASDRDAAQQRKEQAVFEMARSFGVGHLNAGLLEKLPIDLIVESFAGLCDRAGPDLTVALEFMPYSGIPNLAAAWHILENAGRRNSGLIIDAWHWARADMTPADLVGVPADRVISVQLCDVRAEPMNRMRAESLGYRLPPGQGSGDTVGLVRALARHGVEPRVVAVEVISNALVASGVDIAAHVVAGAAREVLTAATADAAR
jgi:sugar phosphate isomerase/epimerase